MKPRPKAIYHHSTCYQCGGEGEVLTTPGNPLDLSLCGTGTQGMGELEARAWGNSHFYRWKCPSAITAALGQPGGQSPGSASSAGGFGSSFPRPFADGVGGGWLVRHYLTQTSCSEHYKPTGGSFHYRCLYRQSSRA